ncbi:lymphocyte cytosolic protein 2a isoform X2 [Paramormyrops kingsleyae]|uniref:lymphocyte cytosolic protein 2a isoform X2 n=1 Tax=Paramormyrops kingsleyae TaxID=1676925 RepID=UPI003B96DE16
MSFDQVPSKSEVMSWNPPRLADYLRKANLTGCDKVVLKYSMNGPRFLNMSDNDLQKFPKLQQPLVTKICLGINKKEEKRGFFSKKPAPQKRHEQEFEQENQGWDSEEFDQSDDDYESPDGDDDVDGGDYESPDDGDHGRGGGDSDNDYEPPPSDRPEDAPLQICPAKPIGDSDYIDNNRNRHTPAKPLQSQPPAPPERPGASLPPPSTSRVPPHLPKCEPSSQRPVKPPAKSPGLPAPHVDRRTKPGSSDRGLPSLPGFPDREEHFPGRKPPMPDTFAAQPRRSVVADKPPDLPRLTKPPLPGPGVNRSSSSVGRQPATLPPALQDDGHMPKPGGGPPYNSNTFPLPTRGPSPRPGPSHSESLPPPMHPGGSLPSRLQMAMGSQRPKPDRLPIPQPQVSDFGPDDEQDLDPRWYVAHVTRAQAEGLLRRINRDGTFLVRDSSKRSSTQPYTLMVLYQDKVYNIQIRYNSEKDVFLLGTGLKNRENFPRVRDIIEFHMKIPLLLIDAKDTGSGPQKQCLLAQPVQY